MVYVIFLILALSLLGLGLFLEGVWTLAMPAVVVAGSLGALLWETLRSPTPHRRPAHTMPKRRSAPPAQPAPPKQSMLPSQAKPFPAQPPQSDHLARRSSIETIAQAVEPRGEFPITPVQPSKQSTTRIETGPWRLIPAAQPTIPSSPAQGQISRPVAPRPATTRTPAQVVTPEHYRRHAGVPGFLYIAHNDEHRAGLFKIGYTTGSPQVRMASLNKEHKEASDIGVFHLVHSVPVAASYDAEQALFDAITAQRVAERREFFFGSQDALIRAVNAAARLTYGDADPLNTIYAESSTWATANQGMGPSLPPVQTQALQTLEHGWVYICRNPWHREDTFRVSFTKVDPKKRLEELNAGQRRFTSQIGFYRIVACVQVISVQDVYRKLQSMLASYRVKGSRVFYQAPLPVLCARVETAVSTGSSARNLDGAGLVQTVGTTAINPDGEHRSIVVELIHGTPHFTWAAWTAACPACRQRLRFKGQIGARGNVNCPSCSGSICTVIGASGVRVEGGLSCEDQPST